MGEEFVEKSMHSRYVYKIESTELSDELDIKDKGEREVKSDSHVSGRCRLVDGNIVSWGGKHTQ